MGQNFDLVLNLSNYRFFRLNFSEAPFLGAVRGDEDFFSRRGSPIWF